MVHWPWSTRHMCRICGKPMAVEVVRYSVRNGEGRQVTWAGVRHYYCPDGCSTAFYDFKKARRVEPGEGADRARTVQQAAWTLTGLYVAVGLVLLYALFMYGAAAVPVPAPWVRPFLWVLVTLGFAAIAALLLLPRRGAAVSTSAGTAASGSQAATAGAPSAASSSAAAKPPAGALAEPARQPERPEKVAAGTAPAASGRSARTPPA